MMREELERIVREAQKRIGALRQDETQMWDLVLIELTLYKLDDVMKTLAAVDSGENANIDAPEEPAAPRH